MESGGDFTFRGLRDRGSILSDVGWVYGAASDECGSGLVGGGAFASEPVTPGRAHWSRRLAQMDPRLAGVQTLPVWSGKCTSRCLRMIDAPSVALNFHLCLLFNGFTGENAHTLIIL